MCGTCRDQDFNPAQCHEGHPSATYRKSSRQSIIFFERYFQSSAVPQAPKHPSATGHTSLKPIRFFPFGGRRTTSAPTHTRISKKAHVKTSSLDTEKHKKRQRRAAIVHRSVTPRVISRLQWNSSQVCSLHHLAILDKTNRGEYGLYSYYSAMQISAKKEKKKKKPTPHKNKKKPKPLSKSDLSN